MVPSFLTWRRRRVSRRGAQATWSCTRAGSAVWERSTSRFARSSCADEPRLRALEVLVGLATADADRTHHAAVSLDERRPKSGHDGHAHQPVDDAEESGTVLCE